MRRPVQRMCTASVLALFVLTATALPTLYRVGPGESNTKISRIAAKLVAGDIVEITGDITDNVELAVHGTRGRPITIRGVTSVEKGRIIRPHIWSASSAAPFIIKITGDWYVVEGIGLAGFKGREWGKAALAYSGSNLTLRNCYFHHNIRATYTDVDTAGDVVVEFCEFEANGYGSKGPTNFYSKVPDATVTIQHCYFHSNTGNSLLRLGYARNVVRYNWFEDQCLWALQITTPEFDGGKDDRARQDRFLPSHSDIIGNVFLSGWRSNTYGALQLGGSSAGAPGTEGDFNIFHNLFVGRRGGTIPFIPIATHGNVDRIRASNNAFVDCRGGGYRVYERDAQWNTLRTQLFVRRRHGREKPEVTGRANWISRAAAGVPPGFKRTVSGKDPRVFDFPGRDFHPLADSPFSGAGVWPLPDGRIVSLIPDFEPQRGIPTDLKPVARPKLVPPAIGPFETTRIMPGFEDDSARLIFDAETPQTAIQWQLPFAVARRKAREYLSLDKPAEALQCARMQFILSPLDEWSLRAAVASVQEALRAADGNAVRARLFEEYALYGSAGRDGAMSTGDDLQDPLAGVSLAVFERPDEYYAELDGVIDARAAMGSPRMYYAYWWQQRWFAVEKAFARIEGGRFAEAYDLLVPLLLDAVRKSHESLSSSEALRNQNLIDRLREGLIAVFKSQTNSVVYAARQTEAHFRLAEYGPTGPDGVMGTADDISIVPSFAQETRQPDPVLFNPALSALSAAHPGSPAIRSLTARLAALESAEALAVWKLNAIAGDFAVGTIRQIVFVAPTAREMLDGLCDQFRTPIVLDSFNKGEAEQAASLVLDRTITAQRAVAGAYKRVLLADETNRERLKDARAYLSAFVLAAYEPSGLPEAMSVLREDLADEAPAFFLVEDACERLDEPWLAARAFDALMPVDGGGVTEAEKKRVLSVIELAQYQRVRSVSVRTAPMGPEEAAPYYREVLNGCVLHAARFPKGRYVTYVEYQNGLLKYRLSDYEGALLSSRKFQKERASSKFVPNAMFTEGVALIGLGRSEEGIATLADVAAKHPESRVAAAALFTAGRACMDSNEYEKAKEYLQLLRDFYPEDPYTVEAAKILEKLASP